MCLQFSSDDTIFDIMIDNNENLKDGDTCQVIKGNHKGKSGIACDFHTSKTGHTTITVLQANGDRFKTLARNVANKA